VEQVSAPARSASVEAQAEQSRGEMCFESFVENLRV